MDIAKSWTRASCSRHAAVAMRGGALRERRTPERAADLLVASAGGEELRVIPGGWRACCLELLTRCQLAAGGARRQSAPRRPRRHAPRRSGCRWPRAMAALAAAALELDAGDRRRRRACAGAAAALDDVGAVFDAAASRMLAGRALAQAGEHDEAAAELERAGSRLRLLRLGPLPRRGRARAAKARAHDPPPHAARQGGRAGSRRSRSANSSSRGSSSIARRIPRSPRRCSSARRPSKRTCGTRSASSASRHASSWRERSSTPTARRTRSRTSTAPVER